MNCQSEKGCRESGDFLLFAPDGEPVPGGHYCPGHVKGIIDEYRDKLGQEWYAYKVDRDGDPIFGTPIFRG